MFKKVRYSLPTLALLFCLLGGGCKKDQPNLEENANNGAADVENVDKKNDNNGSQERVPVETVSVTTGDIASFLLLSSNLETERMSDVYSRTQGLVDKINVEEGDEVKKGQLLMELEPDELELIEARVKVEYERERSLFKRKKMMFEKKLLSKEEFEIAGFSVDAKKISWQEAKLNLDHTQITSPISGVIGERLPRIGDRIHTTDKLFSVINNEEMIAVIHVPEKEVGKIHKKQKAYVTSQHIGDEKFAGWIKRVSPVVDPQSGTFKVTVGIKNEKKKLRPGMFVNVHVITEVHRNTALIPKTAVLYENERMQVFIVQDSLAKKIELKAGFQDYEKVESLSGIEPGAQIIVVGQAGLKDGSRVNVVAKREINFTASQTQP